MQHILSCYFVHISQNLHKRGVRQCDPLLCSSGLNIIVESRQREQSENMGYKKNGLDQFLYFLKGRDHLREKSVGGKTKSKRMLKKYGLNLRNHFAQTKDPWRDILKTVIYFRISQKVGDFLRECLLAPFTSIVYILL
jgi:hypothetical protein